jgi:tRNA(Ile)-lysidine synthase
MTSPSLHPLEINFNRAWPTREWAESHVVLAVSGGPDSVAMLRAAVAIKARCGGGGELFVAHLDHGLRGEASAGDAGWLERLCEQLTLPVEIGRSDVRALAEKQGDGLEATARSARYEFLRQTAERLGARFVATAHTADDQIETVLHRIVRGTGLEGLGGIPAARPLSESVALVRPLLAVRRCEVLDYLAAIGQDYRTDESNADVRWTRNRLRNELLPSIREHYGGDVDAALLRLSAQAGETQSFVAGIAAELANDCVQLEFAPTEAFPRSQVRRIRIECRQLAAQPALLIREVCKAAWHEAAWPRRTMGYDHWRQLAESIRGDCQGPAFNLPGNVRALREGSCLILERSGLS